jgi:hypothetical protein
MCVCGTHCPKVKVRGLTGELTVVKCLFRQVLEGVDYLHKNDIIHRFWIVLNWLTSRDLKISNLLLNSRGILKIGMTTAEATDDSRLWPGKRNDIKTDDSSSRNCLVRSHSPPFRPLILGTVLQNSSSAPENTPKQ